MSRRRWQFRLSTLLSVMLAVAIACAIWINLPLAVRIAIVAAPAALLLWIWEADLLLGIVELLVEAVLGLYDFLPPYISRPRRDSKRSVIRRRGRRAKQDNEQ